MKKICSYLLILALFLVGTASSSAQDTSKKGSDKKVSSTTSTSTPTHSELYKKLTALEGVTSVEKIETPLFSERYVVMMEQPLSHKEPGKGKFKQRFIVSHVAYNAPTVMVTEGYGANYGLRPTYREEISKHFNTNMVVCEHRYFEESTPTPRFWQYLTAENSAYDLHRINQAMRQIYPNKWITTGISKGGQTTMIYRTFFPNDVEISVPYVGPVCFDNEDGRHEPFIRACGGAGVSEFLMDFQREVLSRREEMKPLLAEFIAEKKYDASQMGLDSLLDFCTLEYPFAFWQWGTSPSTIPNGKSDTKVLFDHLMKIAGPEYFLVKNMPSFFVQAAKELGYYGYDTSYLGDVLTVKSAKNYLHDIFLPQDAKDITFNDGLHNKIYKFLKNNDPKIMFVYGQYDPWSAAAPEEYLFYNKQNMVMFVEPAGSHRARIGTLPEKMQQAAWDKLAIWLEE